ncbi:MAG: hypothetical protein JWM59_3776 [Verrucomicrobiales bacterium]|nr:hypothetical protein [Verrucomicrobiales bacterium]
MFPRRAKALFNRAVSRIGVLPLDRMLDTLLSETADLMEVERVSYFRLMDKGRVLRQDLQYLQSMGQCRRGGTVLREKDFPGYFAALREPDSLIVSHEVRTDTRLTEFQESYFRPLGITSMLDAPVHRGGKLFGVICMEHVGPPRRWTDDEMEMARSLGHLVALAVESGERQRMEEELRQALEREKELVRLKINFVNLVSHEFRTPLGIIYSAADILENYFDRLQPAQRTDHLQDIRYAAGQMSKLMEEVLLLGKVESGNMSCRQESFDLADLCRRIVDEQESASHCPGSVALDFTGIGTAAQACGDEGLLRHILGNLVSNAIKYSPGGGGIRLEVRQDAACAEFTVRDQGIGIDPADHENLFTAFHRGRNVGEFPGTGLGLVIVKRCVDLHGGTIHFESRPGEGTHFVIRLELFQSVLRGGLIPTGAHGRA